jgi:uncharacterized integral membrane protein
MKHMNDQMDGNRFIPFTKSDIVTMCIDDAGLPDNGHTAFREFCRILESLIHYEFHSRLEKLKESYAPVNPDADTMTVRTYSAEEKHTLQKQFVETLTSVLNAANFEKITEGDLEDALKEESLFKIRLRVDFNDFEEVIFYRRGESTKQETISKFFGLKKENFSFTNYERVLIYIKFKDEDYFQTKNQKRFYFVPGATIIKLFKNVPKADLEMLFPNNEVRMKTIDKLIIGIPAAASGIVVIATKLGASLLLIASVIAFWLGFADKEVHIEQRQLIALAMGLGTLGGFLFKQINKFKNRKIRFMKALSDNLYFKNLDNNAGVFHHLLDSAEEEEFKEAVLAYYFLLTAEKGLTKTELDTVVETWLEKRHHCRIDFEVGDALNKLERWGLVSRKENAFQSKNLSEAKAQLDQLWDNFFTFHKPGAIP